MWLSAPKDVMIEIKCCANAACYSFLEEYNVLEIVTICFCHHFTPEHSSGENNAAEINVSASKTTSLEKKTAQA